MEKSATKHRKRKMDGRKEPPLKGRKRSTDVALIHPCHMKAYRNRFPSLPMTPFY
jgi:hypothetical protein